MKTLMQALKVRESVFDETKRDDTLDLSNLIDGSIEPERFFEETFITPGMDLLFNLTFRRFEKKADNGIIKLTQSMGGGKTHNLLALGLLSKFPSYRQKLLDGKYGDFDGPVRVIAYTGRESDLKYGIWGEIAKQLGKKDSFSSYYSPLSAPGQTAWINLLKSDTPTLIMLDELPPYLEYCKTQQYGTGTLLDITTTALANLFNALNKEDLANVCLVVSDLKATYEQGSQVIQGIFNNLENEIHRSSTNIEPVSANTDDLYNILKKRLFKNELDEDSIDEIAMAYQLAIKEAKDMNYTDENPSDMAKGIRQSYPFHPSIRDLFARFKENPGFQQTRGFIRLTRLMVKGLFSEIGSANERYLIHPYDIDLNNGEMVSMIKQIKPELSNAISHDIASGGNAIAERMDNSLNSTDMQDVSKLLLMASLSQVTGSVSGLKMNEIYAAISSPGRDIRQLGKSFDDFRTRSWYLFTDTEGRIFFRKVQNVNAQLNDEIRGFTYNQAKIYLKSFLEQRFKPNQADCYQTCLVFPSIEEIDIQKDKVTLIVTEPLKKEGGLQPEILTFYEELNYKNRVMFLTGQRVSMENLIEVTKSHQAINNILYRMVNEDRIEARNPELEQAKILEEKILNRLNSNIREAFTILFYPKKNGLESTDFKMEYTNNHFNAESEIRKTLLDAMKFTTEIEPEKIKLRFEARVFTTRKMTWSFLLERAASETSWSWHKPEALNELKNHCLTRGLWVEDGGYLDKEPPLPETSVNVIVVHRNRINGETTLKLNPINGNTVYYEIDSDATESSARVEDLSSFKTSELVLTFLCVDSTGQHQVGPCVYWKNEVSLQYRVFDQEGQRYMELKASSPYMKIHYSTDGSNPKTSGGIYIEPFTIPNGAKYVQAIAFDETKDVSSELLVYEINDEVFSIDKKRPVKMLETLSFNSTAETFKQLEYLSEVKAKVRTVAVTISEDNGEYVLLDLGCQIEDPKQIIKQTEILIEAFFNTKDKSATCTINSVIFDTGQEFERWISKRNETVASYKDKIVQSN